MAEDLKRPWISACDIPGRGLLLVLWGYFDESGHVEDVQCPVMVMAGAIAERSDWDALAVKWSAILEQFDIKEMHMADFAMSVGEFGGWDKDEPKRRAFLGGLLDAAIEHIGTYLGAAVACPDWKCLPDVQKELLVDPYFQCFQHCVDGAAKIAAFWPTEDLSLQQIELVFGRREESGSFDGGRAYQFYERIAGILNAEDPVTLYGDRLEGISFQRPLSFCGLQLADITAYELGRQCLRIVGHRTQDKRYGFIRISERRCFFNLFCLEKKTGQFKPISV